jgi:chitinase
MRRLLRRSTPAAALAMLVPLVAVLLTSAPAHAAGPTASFAKVSDWGSGFTGEYTIRNGGTAALTGWTVEFDLPAGTTVGSYWDALQTSAAGGHYVFRNREYNGTLAPGATAKFGFVAAGGGTPANCRLNGSPCSSAEPPPPPPPTPPPTDPPPTDPPPTDPPPAPPGGLPKRLLVGYLHASFANGSGYVRMADVPDAWDIIQLAFAEPTSATSGELRFQLCPVAECPNVETEAQFVAAVRAKQARGKKVLISVGGANGQVRLASTAARDAFVRSAGAIIDRYGLDGLDIDFEGHSLALDPGDEDFRNPRSPVIVNLISALRALKARYGSRFVLTMAPETFFVQVGYQHYGPGSGADPRAGAYLPVIHALRNDLTVLHVQHYNSGPIMGLDNQYHFMGGADFHVAMADMVLAGFPVRGDASRVFPGLRQDQVAIGLPASVNAGNGFTPVAEVHKALDCLVRARGCGPYRPRGTYPDLRGLMTWSVNWDRYNNGEFSRSHRTYLDALP